jgi:hypothetical protein
MRIYLISNKEGESISFLAASRRTSSTTCGAWEKKTNQSLADHEDFLLRIPFQKVTVQVSFQLHHAHLPRKGEEGQG